MFFQPTAAGDLISVALHQNYAASKKHFVERIIEPTLNSKWLAGYARRNRESRCHFGRAIWSSAEDYLAVADLVESLQHLTPPGKVARFRLDRFSPLFERAEQFGLANVRPYEVYGDLYDLPAPSIASLAYFFDFDYADGRDVYWSVAPALARIREWKQKSDGDLLKVSTDSPEMTIVDTRLGRQPRVFQMAGFRRQLYEFCDEIQTRANIDRFAAEKEQGETLDAILDEFERNRLVVKEGQQYLSLAVDPRRNLEPSR